MSGIKIDDNYLDSANQIDSDSLPSYPEACFTNSNGSLTVFYYDLIGRHNKVNQTVNTVCTDLKNRYTDIFPFFKEQDKTTKDKIDGYSSNPGSSGGGFGSSGSGVGSW